MRSLLPVLALVTACSNPRLAHYAPAQRPGGVLLQVGVDTVQRNVELLAVSDTGLLVLDSNHVAFARYAAISWLSSDDLPSKVQWLRTTVPTADVRDGLRSLSRFPQGVSGELLERLLRAYGQDSVAVLGR